MKEESRSEAGRRKRAFVRPKLTRYGKLAAITMASGFQNAPTSFGGSGSGFGDGFDSKTF